VGEKDGSMELIIKAVSRRISGAFFQGRT